MTDYFSIIFVRETELEPVIHLLEMQWWALKNNFRCDFLILYLYVYFIECTYSSLMSIHVVVGYSQRCMNFHQFFPFVFIFIFFK